LNFFCTCGGKDAYGGTQFLRTLYLTLKKETNSQEDKKVREKGVEVRLYKYFKNKRFGYVEEWIN
jgi:hypothetical protein